MVGCVVGGALAARETMSASASRGSGGVTPATREEVELLKWLEKQEQEVDKELVSESTKTTPWRRLRSWSENEISSGALAGGSGVGGCRGGSGVGGGDEGNGAGDMGGGGGSGGGGGDEGGGGCGSDNPNLVTGEARARAERRVAVFPLPSPSTVDATETAGGSGEGGSGGGGAGGEVVGAPDSPEEHHFRRVAADLAQRGVKNLQGVEYLVNPPVEDMYEEKRREMRARLGSAGVNERLLFHGTSFEHSEEIRHENFSLDKVGRVLTFFAFTRLPGIPPPELVWPSAAAQQLPRTLMPNCRYRNVGLIM